MADSYRIKHLITGTGRSGTTFFTHVLYNAGLDCGDVHPQNISAEGDPVGGGMELGHFARLNAQLMRDINQLQLEEVVEKHKEALHEIWPMYVKDPRFTMTWPVWNKAGIKPMHVFICIRDPDATDISIKKTTQWNMNNPFRLYRELYGLLTYILENDISHTFVQYPRLAHDKEYAEELLEPYITNPWDVVRKTWDDNLHHFKTKS